MTTTMSDVDFAITNEAPLSPRLGHTSVVFKGQSIFLEGKALLLFLGLRCGGGAATARAGMKDSICLRVPQ